MDVTALLKTLNTHAARGAAKGPPAGGGARARLSAADSSDADFADTVSRLTEVAAGAIVSQLPAQADQALSAVAQPPPAVPLWGGKGTAGGGCATVESVGAASDKGSMQANVGMVIAAALTTVARQTDGQDEVGSPEGEGASRGTEARATVKAGVVLGADVVQSASRRTASTNCTVTGRASVDGKTKTTTGGATDVFHATRPGEAATEAEAERQADARTEGKVEGGTQGNTGSSPATATSEMIARVAAKITCQSRPESVTVATKSQGAADLRVTVAKLGDTTHVTIQTAAPLPPQVMAQIAAAVRDGLAQQGIDGRQVEVDFRAVNRGQAEPSVAAKPEAQVAEATLDDPPVALRARNGAAPTRETAAVKPAASSAPEMIAARSAQGVESPGGEAISPATNDDVANPTAKGQKAAVAMFREALLSAAFGNETPSHRGSSARLNQGETAAPVASVARPTGLTNIVSMAPSSPSPAATLDRVDFVEQVVRQMRSVIRNGQTQEIRIDLKPSELGSVRLTLSMRDDAVQARLQVDSPATQDALERLAPRVREALAQEHIELQAFDVNLRYSGGRSDHRGEPATPRPNGRDFAEALAGDERRAPAAPSLGGYLPADGLMNFVV